MKVCDDITLFIDATATLLLVSLFKEAHIGEVQSQVTVREIERKRDRDRDNKVEGTTSFFYLFRNTEL